MNGEIPLKLQFTDGEQAVVREARMIYEVTITTIARIHGVRGRIDVDPQFRGFVDIEALEALPPGNAPQQPATSFGPVNGRVTS